MVDVVRSTLESRASASFLWLLISSGLVAIGCIAEIGETWLSLLRWYRRKRGLPFEEENPLSLTIPLGAIGLIFVIIGVIGEGVSEGFLSVEETRLRAYDEQKLVDTIQLAGTAASSAEAAQTASSSALRDAGTAETKADIASTTAEGAQTTASSARKEADGFEKDIVETKSKAADAESHLADALQRAAAAEEELKKIHTSRNLEDVANLVAGVRRYAGVEYTLEVNMGNEAAELAAKIGDALNRAGWKREQPAVPLGVPSVDVFKDGIPVAACLSTGIVISVRESHMSAYFKALPDEHLPLDLRAALALRAALGRSIVPDGKLNTSTNVSLEQPLGGPKPITICVGSKP